MNDSYIITTEVTADLSRDIVESSNLVMIPMTYSIDGKEYAHYHDFREMSSSEFYKRLDDGFDSKTTQVNPEGYVNIFESILQSGKDILYIGFSSGLSGSFNSALIAKNILSEKYPNQMIHCVDSLSASSGQGLLVYLALKNQESGMSLDDNNQWVENHKLNIAHWCLVNNLNHLQRGGRISAAAATIGGILHVHPILRMSDTGILEVKRKERGQKKAVSRLTSIFNDSSIPSDNPIIFITHADNESGAQLLQNEILKSAPHAVFYITEMGPIIGSHTGKGTVCIFYLATTR